MTESCQLYFGEHCTRYTLSLGYAWADIEAAEPEIRLQSYIIQTIRE